MRLGCLTLAMAACASAPAPDRGEAAANVGAHPHLRHLDPLPGPLWSGLDEAVVLDSGGPPSANQPPHADAGPDFTAVAGVPLALTASASTDPDGDALTAFAWSVLAAPLGSASTLESVATVEASLVPDMMGVYVVQLHVSDGQRWSSPDLITLIITDTDGTPPDIAGGAP